MPKLGYLGPKVNFLYSDRDFCQWSKWPQYPGLQLSQRNHPQKNFRFRARGHFLGLTPVFGHSHVRGVPSLNFDPISTKLGGTVRAIEKMTQKDNGPGPGRNYGETGIFTFGRKVVFGLKMGLTPKNHPKWHFPLDYLGKGNFFLWSTFSGRGQNMVRVQKCLLFFWPKISVFGPKIQFLPYHPNFRWWPIFSPRHDG